MNQAATSRFGGQRGQRWAGHLTGSGTAGRSLPANGGLNLGVDVTSCGIVPQPADEGQHRGREKAADEQSGERASRRAMRAIPTPKDKRRIVRVSVWAPPASGRYTIPGMTYVPRGW